MSEEWQYQVRIELPPATAELARRDPEASELRPLAAILARHQATLTCQFDAFAGYVAEAEREAIEHYPLYEWTKKTIEDPEKKAKFRRLSSRRAVIDIGSQAQPFQVFIPDIETDEGVALVNLVHERYLAEDDGRTTIRASRSYAYVQGGLQIFRDTRKSSSPALPALLTPRRLNG